MASWSTVSYARMVFLHGARKYFESKNLVKVKLYRILNSDSIIEFSELTVKHEPEEEIAQCLIGDHLFTNNFGTRRK